MDTKYVMGIDPEKVNGTFPEGIATEEYTKETLHYQQMDPEYMFPYDAEGVKQELLKILSDGIYFNKKRPLGRSR